MGVGGHAGALVVDPGPLDELHLAAVVAAADGHVGLVLLTHGHPDHSDGALLLQEMTGAAMAAADPRFCVGTEPLRGGTRLDGVAGLDVRVLATPGHTADSVSFVVPGDQPGGLDCAEFVDLGRQAIQGQRARGFAAIGSP